MDFGLYAFARTVVGARDDSNISTATDRLEIDVIKQQQRRSCTVCNMARVKLWAAGR